MRPAVRRTGAGGLARPPATILPVLAIVAVFTIYPLVYALSVSLHKNVLTMPFDHSFVGLRNYAEVIGSDYFRAALASTMVFAVMAVTAVLAYGVFVGLLLNLRLWVTRVLQVLIILPWAVPAAIAGIMWKWVFHSDYGALNDLLVRLGLLKDYFPWLSVPATARVCLTVAHVWKEGSLAAILFLAGLQTIPDELHDAIRVDGGGALADFRYVVVPFLKPTLTVLAIYETMVSIIAFDLVYVMTGGGPANATCLISWFAYIQSFRFLNFGHGTALAFVIAVAVLAIVLVYLRALRTEEVY